MPGTDPLNGDAQAQPPHRKLGELKEAMGGSERDAVVRADGSGQATLAEEALKGPESEFFAVGFQRLA